MVPTVSCPDIFQRSNTNGSLLTAVRVKLVVAKAFPRLLNASSPPKAHAMTGFFPDVSRSHDEEVSLNAGIRSGGPGSRKTVPQPVTQFVLVPPKCVVP